MDKTVFESFEDYLEEANYPQGKKKIMQAAVDLISTRSYHGTSTLPVSYTHLDVYKRQDLGWL